LATPTVAGKWRRPRKQALHRTAGRVRLDIGVADVVDASATRALVEAEGANVISPVLTNTKSMRGSGGGQARI
jgi:hypothetical protein